MNNDTTETVNAIRELNVASFHWYVVKKAVLLALDSKESDVDKLIKLLNTFYTSQLISEVCAACCVLRVACCVLRVACRMDCL